MSTVKFSLDKNSTVTPINNIFFDIYMTKANPAYVIVYLYTYRQCYNGSTELSIKSIADSMDILETDVIRAFKYWEEKGLVIIDSENNEMSIKFIDLCDVKQINRQSYIEEKEITEQKQEPEKVIPKTELITELPIKKQVYILDSRPSYSTHEINLYMDNNESVRNLFKFAERNLGKLLSYTEMSILFSLHDWLKLPINVIELLISYCASNDHRNIRYIEKTAVDWCEKNILTVDAAKEHIRLHNADYRKVMKAFGIKNRDPVETEEAYMTKWLKILKMPIEVIAEACDKAVMLTGHANFPYADKIIIEWSEKGVATLEQVKKSDEEYYKNKERNMKEKEPIAKKKAMVNQKVNRFVNYTQRSDWDFAELERLEREYVDRELDAGVN